MPTRHCSVSRAIIDRPAFERALRRVSLTGGVTDVDLHHQPLVICRVTTGCQRSRLDPPNGFNGDSGSDDIRRSADRPTLATHEVVSCRFRESKLAFRCEQCPVQSCPAVVTPAPACEDTRTRRRASLLFCRDYGRRRRRPPPVTRHWGRTLSRDRAIRGTSLAAIQRVPCPPCSLHRMTARAGDDAYMLPGDADPLAPPCALP